MKKTLRVIAFALTICAGWHCAGNELNKKVNEVTGDAQVHLIPVYLLDSLEHFYGNENWMQLSGKDTSFILFSRQGTPEIKVYNYSLKEGDSTNSHLSLISFRGDSLVWLQQGREWILSDVKANKLKWKSGTDSLAYSKQGGDKISLTSSEQQVSWTKTLTLSDFLVRSRYDWLHGTRYAFDTLNFNRLLQEKKSRSDKERKLINTGAN